MMRSALAALIVLTTLCMTAQQRTLKTSRSVPIDNVRAGPLGFLQCDTEGTLYFRYVVPPGSFGAWVRIRPDGKASTFELPSKYDSDEVLDGKPGPSEFYLLVERTPVGSASAADISSRANDESRKASQPEYVVVVLDEHGETQSEIRLDVDFWPKRIAVFSSGSLLVIGSRQDDKGTSVPVTVIVDSHGRVQTTVRLKNDVSARQLAMTSDDTGNSKPDGQNIENKRQLKFEQQLSYSILQSGDDGRIYLVRSGMGNDPIYAIGESGEAVRIILRSAYPGKHPTAVRVSHGTIMFYYGLPKKNPRYGPMPKVFTVWDLGTHEQIAEYFDETPNLGYAFGCYEPGRFTFLKNTRTNGLELVTAVPE